jgi:methylenetetrahydrofolate reductase (NADPH)
MSRLEDALLAGRPAITAEMPTIDGGGVAEVERKLEPLGEWADAVNVTDNPGAHAHASSLAVALALHHRGVEPVMQLTGRDRNRLALQGDIVGAALHGIENFCFMTGDEPSSGDEPDAKGVFDLDGTGLIKLGRTIGGGRYLSGRPIEPPPHLFVGGAETPDPSRVARALAKADAGAQFLQLQLCFVPDRLEAFTAAAVESGLTDRVALLPSISLLSTARSLRFMDEKVWGVDVPAKTIERVESAADPTAACLDLAAELAEHALSLPGIAGLHLISFRRDTGVAELCTRLGIRPRAEREHAHRPSVAI